MTAAIHLPVILNRRCDKCHSEFISESHQRLRVKQADKKEEEKKEGGRKGVRKKIWVYEQPKQKEMIGVVVTPRADLLPAITYS